MSRTLYSGNQKECGTVTGRPVRLNGVTCLAQRHPVTGWTFFCVDPETIRAVPPSGQNRSRAAEGAAKLNRLAYEDNK